MAQYGTGGPKTIPGQWELWHIKNNILAKYQTKATDLSRYPLNKPKRRKQTPLFLHKQGQSLCQRAESEYFWGDEMMNTWFKT